MLKKNRAAPMALPPAAVSAPVPKAAPGILSGAYRTVWRWHFYAGLLVLPILMLMALTGALYLFKDEIDGAVYRDMAVVAHSRLRESPDAWRTAAEAATGGEATAVLIPASDDRAARLTVALGDGEKRTVFVDRADARVTGITSYGGVMETVKRLHSLVIAGPWANALVEVVAGWTIILVATGIFLWWPRHRDAAVALPRTADVRRRPFWRDLHALTGLYAGVIVLFLAVTGMPWSVVWGKAVGDWVKDSGLGRPPARASASPWQHAEHGAEPLGVGWTMEGMVMPGAAPAPASLSTVVAAADAVGLVRPYQVAIPRDPTLAFTVSRQVRRVEDTRTLYIDGGTGAVKADIGYDRFGAGAKATEWGIAVHQGTQYGEINRIVMLTGCIAIWLLGISAIVMWWKRRPKGRLAAPVAPPGPRAKAAVLGIVLPLTILYPLTGLSLIVAVLLDRIVAWLSRSRVDV